MFNWIKKILAKPKEEITEKLEYEFEPEMEKPTQVLTIVINGNQYTTENEEEIGELLKMFSEHFSKTQ